MSKSKPTVEDEIRLLIRAIRMPRFRFVVVQYNHYDLVRLVQQKIKLRYSDRTSHFINLKEKIHENLAHDIVQCAEGFVFIEHFEQLFQAEYARTTLIFNQKRDNYSTLPLILIAFLPSGNRYLQQLSQAVPDMFSIVQPLIQLEQELSASTKVDANLLKTEKEDFIKKDTIFEAIERINKRLMSIENTPENQQLIYLLKKNLAKAYYSIAAYNKSKKVWEELLTLNPSPFERTKIQANLALIYRSLEQYNKAAQLLETALDFAKSNFSDEHITLNKYRADLANVYSDLKRYDEAIPLLETALDFTKKSFDAEDSPTIAEYQADLAKVYIHVGRYNEAIQLLQKAINTAINSLGRQHPLAANYQVSLANVYQNVGRYKEAEFLNDAALKTIQSASDNVTKTNLSTYKNSIPIHQILSDSTASISKQNIQKGIEDIRQLISKSKVKVALEELLQLSKGMDTDIQNQVILLTSRWNRIRQETLMGTISQEQASIQQNRILMGMLGLLEDFE